MKKYPIDIHNGFLCPDLAFLPIRTPKSMIINKPPSLSLFFYLPILFFSLLLLGCEGQQEAPPPPPLPTIFYITVQKEPIILTQELPGRISAFRVAEVRPQVSGIIQIRFFEEGTDVQAGQVLYQIDPALYQAAYNNAKANLGRAKATEETVRLLAERYIELARSNAISLQERDDAIAAHKQNKAEIEAHKEILATAAINLGYTKIVAPVSGRIGHSFVSEGTLVTQNQAQALAKIQQISPMYVDVTQSSNELLKLKLAQASGALKTSANQGAKVRLHLEDGTLYKRLDSDEWIEGTLLFSDISVDKDTGTVTLRAKFENPHELLLPGMYARATLVQGLAENAIVIPQRAVFRDNRNLPQVFVLHPAENATQPDLFTTEARSIVIDREHQGRWLLASGLKHQELLLVEGLQNVRPGQLVKGKPMNATLAPEHNRPEQAPTPLTP